MVKKLSQCTLDELRVTSVTLDLLRGKYSCTVGLSAGGVPRTQAEVTHIQTLDGVNEAIESLVEVVENAVVTLYGEPGDDVEPRATLNPPPGLGDI